MSNSRMYDLVDVCAALLRGDAQAKTAMRMSLVWVGIVVGFPTFLWVSEGAIGHMTLTDWERQHLFGPPWWQPCLKAIWFFVLANIPSTVLIAIASWRVARKDGSYSSSNAYATACATVIPPLSVIIMLAALLYALSAVLYVWTIVLAPGFIVVGMGIVGVYVGAIALWSHLCRRFFPSSAKTYTSSFRSV